MLKGWKTLLFGIALAVIGALEAFDWAQVIPENYSGIAIGVIGIVVVYLRKITNTAIGKNE